MKKSKYKAEEQKEIVNARLGGMLYGEIKDRWGVYPSQVLSWSKSLGINLKNSVAKVKRKSRLVLKAGAQQERMPKLSNESYDIGWLSKKLRENGNEGYVVIGKDGCNFVPYISRGW